MGSLCHVKLMSAPTLARACGWHSFGQATWPARHDPLVGNAGGDAELIPELEFEQTLGW